MLPDRIVAIDFETFLIGPENVLPKPVCLSICDTDEDAPALLHARFDDVRGALQSYLRQAAAGQLVILGQNVAFDMLVAGDHLGLLPEVYAAYEAGTVRDLAIRSKLYHVQSHGSIDSRPMPDGTSKANKYSLAHLVEEWLGEDIFDTKKGDAWRLKYGTLAETPLDQWDKDALEYALDDAEYPVRVWKRIESVGGHLFKGSDRAEILANQAALACMRATANGMRIDPAYAQQLFKRVQAATKDIDALIEADIITPALPARPYANGAKDHVAGCTGKVRVPDGTYKNGNPKFRTEPCDCPVKMSAATPQKSNDTQKRTWFRNWMVEQRPDLMVPLTDGGAQGYKLEHGTFRKELRVDDPWFDANPRTLKLETETVEELLVDTTDLQQREVIEQYLKFQRTTKLWSSFLPGMMWDQTNEVCARETWKDPGTLSWGVRAHPNFDVLKRTGRMSSWGGSLYPSMNVQQQDPEVRPCFIADPGSFLLSTDFKALELFSAASTWKRLFGESILHQILSLGYDPHGFLGAQLAAAMAKPCRFTPMGDLSANYKAFEALKKGDDQDRKFYKYWRKFAKPVGLGFPGGLGISTMRSMAWAMYGLQISEDQAVSARELWMNTFPEARKYLKVWVTDQVDTINSDENGEDLYMYTSPAGMVRRGCSYTAAANGMSLQTPAAEGLRRCAFRLTQMTDVRSKDNRVLQGAKFLAPIHDEIIMQIPIHEDWQQSVDAIEAVERVMVEEMSDHLGIACEVESAAMFRWRKFLPNEPWAEGYDDFDARIPIDPEPTYYA